MQVPFTYLAVPVGGGDGAPVRLLPFARQQNPSGMRVLQLVYPWYPNGSILALPHSLCFGMCVVIAATARLLQASPVFEAFWQGRLIPGACVPRWVVNAWHDDWPCCSRWQRQRP